MDSIMRGDAMDIDSRRLSTASELHFAVLPVASTGFGQIQPEWEAARTAYEWNDTRQRAQVFQNTLHNDTAAVDAVVRQGA